MEHTDLTKLYDQHKTAFDAASTFSDFIATAPLTDAYKKHLERYAGGWADRSFLTHKAHGFVARPLALPNAKRFSELFEAVEIHPYVVQGPRIASEESGLLFVSDLRGKNVAYFGHVAGKLYIKVDRNDEFFCFGITQNKNVCTYARPKRETLDALNEHLMSDRWFSIEIVTWSTGQHLVIGRDGHSIGSRWLAVVDADDTLMSMAPEADRKAIDEWRAYEAKVRALVDGKTVDIEGAKAMGVEIRRA